MKEVECGDCGGSGRVIGSQGGKSMCMNCGGAGSMMVEESEITEEMEDRIIDE